MSALKDGGMPIAWTENKRNVSAYHRLGYLEIWQQFRVYELSILEYFEECITRFWLDSTSGFVLHLQESKRQALVDAWWRRGLSCGAGIWHFPPSACLSWTVLNSNDWIHEMFSENISSRHWFLNVGIHSWFEMRVRAECSQSKLCLLRFLSAPLSVSLSLSVTLYQRLFKIKTSAGELTLTRKIKF